MTIRSLTEALKRVARDSRIDPKAHKGYSMILLSLLDQEGYGIVEPIETHRSVRPRHNMVELTLQAKIDRLIPVDEHDRLKTEIRRGFEEKFDLEVISVFISLTEAYTPGHFRLYVWVQYPIESAYKKIPYTEE